MKPETRAVPLQLVLEAGADLGDAPQRYEAAVQPMRRRGLSSLVDSLEQIRSGSSGPWPGLRQRMSGFFNTDRGSPGGREIARAVIASKAVAHISKEQSQALKELWRSHAGVLV